MKTIASSGFLLSLAGWALLVLTFVNLLSGSLETRECGTDCVRNYYFGASLLGVIALLAALLTVFPRSTRSLGSVTLVIALPLVAIAGGIYLIGNYGHLLH